MFAYMRLKPLKVRFVPDISSQPSCTAALASTSIQFLVSSEQSLAENVLDKHRDADSELIIFLLSSDCSLCAGWPAFSLGFMSGSKAVIITE